MRRSDYARLRDQRPSANVLQVGTLKPIHGGVPGPVALESRLSFRDQRLRRNRRHSTLVTDTRQRRPGFEDNRPEIRVVVAAEKSIEGFDLLLSRSPRPVRKATR